MYFCSLTKKYTMKKILLPFYFIYQFLIYWPIAFIISILTCIITFTMSMLFNPHFWGYYPGKIWSILMCYLALCPVKIEGRDKIKNNQSYVFALNHQSSYDIFMVYGFLGHNFKWIMKEEIKKVPLLGAACKAAGHVFVNRTNRKAAYNAIQEAKTRITNGTSIVIFPEGTRRKGPNMLPFKKGGFYIAQDLELPIVPVTIVGTYEMFPVGAKYILPQRLKLIFHDPIPYSKENSDDMDALVERVRNEVASSL